MMLGCPRTTSIDQCSTARTEQTAATAANLNQRLAEGRGGRVGGGGSGGVEVGGGGDAALQVAQLGADLDGEG
jgi:hypothetical protein